MPGSTRSGRALVGIDDATRDGCAVAGKAGMRDEEVVQRGFRENRPLREIDG